MRRQKSDFFLGMENNSRGKIYLGVIIIFFSVLLMRMFYLQVLQGKEFRYLSEKNQFKLKKITSPRGQIFDSTGKLIVTNGVGYHLVYLRERNHEDEYVDAIVELTGYDKQYILKRIKYGEIFPYTRENVLIEDLEEEKAYKLMEKIVDYPYLEVQAYSKRKYLYDSVAAHSIGYVKKISKKEYEALKEEGYTPRDVVGKEGLERQYDRVLKGEDGYEYIEVNAFNKIQRKMESRDPIPGKNLHLSLNMELQQYMEEQYREEGRAGAFIALDAKTGEIITLVSYPTFSLNMFSSQISQAVWNEIMNDKRRPLGNKAVAGEYPPGSVFKVISALAFLESGIDPKQKYLDATGYYQIGKWKWRAWKRGGHGLVDMKKSLVESANPYYYRLADQVGYKPIADMAKRFGLGSLTGIDIPGERAGVIPTPDWKKKKIKASWVKGDSILMSIGQGYDLVTPLQIAKAYSIIANKGYAYSPHLVKYLEDVKTKKRERVMGRRMEVKDLPKEYYDIINDALIATVSQDNGTTRVLRNPNYLVAAKSGSAQNSQSKTTHAWVAGYFPADNPEIVFTALLTAAGGGGAVAGGMTKKFMDKYDEMKNPPAKIEKTEETINE
ncbi:MAG TPA: penicillin-binding protein 2 [Fusobacterium sp.]|uniref:penicillin-binding protein 2 n=1 Tax=Fusobacterium sp. TaxID=68766 RepID=UPI002F3F6B00